MNRREQNLAKQRWDALKDAVASLDGLVTEVLARGTYDANHRVNPKPEDEWSRLPGPDYQDETGETAVKAPVDDAIRRSVLAMAKNISLALDIAKYVVSVTPEDVAERARREVPDCRACGKPVEGRVISGYDSACYQAWRRAGFPDRAQFESDRLKSVNNDSSSA